jgi:hypothetical protein
VKLQMGLYPRSILILKNNGELEFMTYSISDHIVNIVLVTVGYIVSMLFVQFVIIPVQQTYLPMITTFAALIFPLHGVRVLAAWLFGWRSIFYLFLANILNPKQRINAEFVIRMDTSELRSVGHFRQLKIHQDRFCYKRQSQSFFNVEDIASCGISILNHQLSGTQYNFC